MKLKAFIIHDSGVNAFLQPFFMLDTNQALRSFTNEANSPTSQINKSPHHYTLLEIGEFDDETGNLTVHEFRQKICTAVEVKKAEESINDITLKKIEQLDLEVKNLASHVKDLMYKNNPVNDLRKAIQEKAIQESNTPVQLPKKSFIQKF